MLPILILNQHSPLQSTKLTSSLRLLNSLTFPKLFSIFSLTSLNFEILPVFSSPYSAKKLNLWMRSVVSESSPSSDSFLIWPLKVCKSLILLVIEPSLSSSSIFTFWICCHTTLSLSSGSSYFGNSAVFPESSSYFSEARLWYSWLYLLLLSYPSFLI